MVPIRPPAPTVAATAAASVSQKLDQFQSNTGILLDARCRNMLFDVVSESLARRWDEWIDEGADPIDPSSASAVGKILDTSLELILTETGKAVQSNGREQLDAGFGDLLRAIHAEWCGVFPFCKKVV